MRANHGVTVSSLYRPALFAVWLLTFPLIVAAQDVPAVSSTAASIDMGSMPGMSMPAAVARVAAPAVIPRASKKPVAKPAGPPKNMHGMEHAAMEAPTSSDNMQGMNHAAMPEMGHGSMPGMSHSAQPMTGMTMAPMQGGRPPPDTRSPDYSDGLGHVSAHGSGMHDNGPLGMLLIDRLEAFHAHDGNGQSWEVEGWYGDDEDKLWLRSEGERSGGKLEDGQVEVLWNRTVTTFWSTQLGVRHDFGRGPQRNWAAFGVQGLAPYWFELEATGYVGPSGHTAARLRADYELLFTQRLILQPEVEINIYGQSDPARSIGSGLSDAQLGLRLRYEIRREFAPYAGVVWTRRFGASADYARDGHAAVFEQQWVAGLRIWF